MEVAAFFHQLPAELLTLPLSEYRKMVRYWRGIQERRLAETVEEFRKD